MNDAPPKSRYTKLATLKVPEAAHRQFKVAAITLGWHSLQDAAVHALDAFCAKKPRPTGKK